MLQIIFMVIGTFYLFRLIGLNGRAVKLTIDEPDSIARWRFHRRRQYLWMIAAGWGIAVVSIVVSAAISATVQLTSGSALVVQAVLIVLAIAGMITCAVISSKAGTEADKIEAARQEQFLNQGLTANGTLASDDSSSYYVKRSEKNNSFYKSLNTQQVLEELAMGTLSRDWFIIPNPSGRSYNDLVRDPSGLTWETVAEFVKRGTSGASSSLAAGGK